MSFPGRERRRRPRHPEDRLRAIIDHVADGIVIVGADGLVRFVNPAAEQMFGRAAAELLDHPFGFPLVAEERAEIDILRRAGGAVVAELRVVEMEWEGEAALLVSLRDVTHRKEAEERQRELLREQAARARAEVEERRSRFLAEAGTVLDSSLDYHQVLARLARLVVAPHSEIRPQRGSASPPPRLADWCVIDMVEGEGELVRVAAAHHEPAREPLLRELGERFPPDWEQPYPAARVLRTGEPLLVPELTDERLAELTRSPAHVRLLRRIGGSSVMAVPLVARGSVFGAITLVCAGQGYHHDDLSLARDLAQRAALSIANARLYREAQEANRAKGDFLAVMSHELRTPLNAIMGYTDLLAAGVSGPVSDRQREQLDRIRDSSRHLLQIVEEILTYARVEAGREELHTARVELGEVLQEVGSMVQPLAERKGILFVVRQPNGPVALETDPGKLRQILLNLLSNAVKFTEHGTVRLEATPDGAGHIIRVSDTGIGIPEEHLQRVFEPFWQVEQSTRRSAGGTGLGLSVAHRLAGLIGGSLRAESREGQGSTFTLWVPERIPGPRRRGHRKPETGDSSGRTAPLP